MSAVRHFLTTLGVLTARPGAFLVLAGYIIAWLILDRSSLDWHAAATLATWFMTLVIQRAEHRDTQALQAKLDELLRSMPNSDGEVADIDDKEPEDIERHRTHESAQAHKS